MPAFTAYLQRCVAKSPIRPRGIADKSQNHAAWRRKNRGWRGEAGFRNLNQWGEKERETASGSFMEGRPGYVVWPCKKTNTGQNVCISHFAAGWVTKSFPIVNLIGKIKDITFWQWEEKRNQRKKIKNQDKKMEHPWRLKRRDPREVVFLVMRLTALPATYGLQETPEEEEEARVNVKGP